MLKNSKDLLQEARQHKFRVAAFNVYSLETMQAAFAAARMAEKPLIVAFGENYLNHSSLPMMAAMARVLAEDFPHTAVLHLDHCKSLETIEKAMKAGFTSVMYDGSALPLKDNIHNTQKVTAMAADFGVSVEGELGGMNAEDGEGPAPGEEAFTTARQAQTYVDATGIDSLAVSIGNSHGVYKGLPKLDFQRLEDISQAVHIPLVLHGCSGIPAEDLKKAVALGIAKINVNTEVALAGGDYLQEATAAGTQRLDKLLPGLQKALQKAMLPFLQG